MHENILSCYYGNNKVCYAVNNRYKLILPMGTVPNISSTLHLVGTRKKYEHYTFFMELNA